MMGSRHALLVGGLAALCVWAATLPGTAGASDRLFWSNNNASAISFSSLDGSGAGDFFNSAQEPAGLAIDSVTGRLYYTNEAANTISFVNLNGGGGGMLNTGTATVEVPDGLAIDPASRKIFWANDGIPGSIAFASLDGAGGENLNTNGATLDGPSGITVDPASGRVYWSNYDGDTISFANLNNTGGGEDLKIGAATATGPAGVAIDPGSRRIFWSGAGGTNNISFASLDGSGGGDLSTSGAITKVPYGVAIDPEAGRIYWANNGDQSPSFARLDNSGGGGQLTTAGATLSGPSFPILVKTPAGAGAPAISGGTSVGTTLSCSQGSWAPDVFPALMYRAPIAFAYQWSREGKDVAGATSASVTASQAGQYVCRVTGSNPAGSAIQSSAPHRVGPPVPPDFDTALLEGSFLYLRLKCADRFKPECLGSAAALTSKTSCPKRHRARCKAPQTMTASVSAKQKPNKWKVAKLKIKPAFKATVTKMAKEPQKKLLIVRQLVHAKKFKGGRAQSVFHIYRVRTATP
jgi:DNA-binding beta-propeller fold protein YncE